MSTCYRRCRYSGFPKSFRIPPAMWRLRAVSPSVVICVLHDRLDSVPVVARSVGRERRRRTRRVARYHVVNSTSRWWRMVLYSGSRSSANWFAFRGRSSSARDSRTRSAPPRVPINTYQSAASVVFVSSPRNPTLPAPRVTAERDHRDRSTEGTYRDPRPQPILSRRLHRFLNTLERRRHADRLRDDPRDEEEICEQKHQ